MATTPNLNLFRPGTDDNVGIETSLNDNFVTVDTKLGDSLKNAAGTVYTSLGNRLNATDIIVNTAQNDVNIFKTKGVNALINDHVFKTISRQGIPSCPPNTLVSYRYAAEWGYWGIYADVQLTSDKIWMCFGDTTLDDKTSATGPFSAKTQAQIKALEVGTAFDPAYWIGEQIPDLDDLMLICRTTQCIPMLNIVGTYVDLDIQLLTNMIKKWDVISDSAIVSNQLSNLQRVRLYDPTIAVGLFVNSHSTTTLDSIAALGNAFALYTDDQITLANMADAEAKKVPVVAFMSSDNNQRMREILPFGVRGAVTRKTPAIRGS